MVFFKETPDLTLERIQQDAARIPSCDHFITVRLNCCKCKFTSDRITWF